MKNLLAISILAGLAVFVIAGGVVSAEDLVVFDRAKIAEAGQECQLSVIAKLDDKAVGLIRSGGCEKLKKIDSGARLLESSTNLEQLWVAGSPEDTPDLPGMLLRTDNFQLLRLSFQDAAGLMSDGYYLSKCQRTNLPADPLFYVPPKIISRTSITADIDSLMDLVSVDSVEAYIQRLQDFQTRYTCTDSFWAAGDWIAGKFESWGYDNVYFEEFDSPFNCPSSRNVVAEKTGEVYPERYVIVGGHYDAVVYDGGDPNEYAPGADDNASGTALTLEIARVLADTPFRKTVRFIAFGAEEQGRYGSWYHATQSLNRGDDIELMINADMIGNVEDSYLNFGVNCNETGEPYGQVLADLAEEHTTLIPEIHVGSFGGSDHYPFDQSGFRTVYSDEGDFSPNWHRQTDVIENIDVAYASDIVRSNLGLLMITMTTTVPVTDLEAFNAGDGHTVYLQWSESPDIDVIGYEVYVGTSEDGVAVYDTAYAPADTVYNLEEEVGYYFGVAALLSDGGRSLIEEFVQLTPRSIPGAPTALDILPRFGSLRVDWEVSQDMDFDYYQVYRKIGENGEYQTHMQVTDGMTLIDEDLQSNIRYYYQVSQVDTAGLESDLSPADYAKIISLDSGILLVDETRDYSGGQGSPTDAEQDSFYQFISDGYLVEFADINDEGVLRINDIGAYSTIAWMDDDATSQYIQEAEEVLAAYLDMGGNLLFTGWRSFYDYSIPRPHLFGNDDFPYTHMFISEINANNNPDFSGATGLDGWPDLDVDPERVIPQWNGRLIGVDIMDFFGETEAIYNFVSASGDTLFDGKPVGIALEHDDYRLIHLTFSLYVMGDLNAREAFVTAMEFFGEQSTGTDEFIGSETLPTAFLSQNYPNPFNNETRIKFVLSEKNRVRLAIYNILGQEIAVLADGEFPSGVHYVGWDGAGLPSGVYFYRLMVDGGAISRRMTLIR